MDVLERLHQKRNDRCPGPTVDWMHREAGPLFPLPHSTMDPLSKRTSQPELASSAGGSSGVCLLPREKKKSMPPVRAGEFVTLGRCARRPGTPPPVSPTPQAVLADPPARCRKHPATQRRTSCCFCSPQSTPGRRPDNGQATRRDTISAGPSRGCACSSSFSPANPQ